MKEENQQEFDISFSMFMTLWKLSLIWQRCECLTHVLCGAESTPGVQEVELEKRLPCERMLLTAWEQRHCCTLPEDLRQFYMSADGFKLIWNYEYAG
jgi:hypothetical protein